MHQKKSESTLKEAMAIVKNQCLQTSLLLTALLFVTTSISFVSGQPGHGGEWFIYESG